MSDIWRNQVVPKAAPYGEVPPDCDVERFIAVPSDLMPPAGSVAPLPGIPDASPNPTFALRLV
jgi:hypothetical protein